MSDQHRTRSSLPLSRNCSVRALGRVEAFTAGPGRHRSSAATQAPDAPRHRRHTQLSVVVMPLLTHEEASTRWGIHALHLASPSPRRLPTDLRSHQQQHASTGGVMMNVLLTGGSGDLGTVVARKLAMRGDKPVKLDPRSPEGDLPHIEGSVLDRTILDNLLPDIQCVVHISAWHGIHEFRKEKDAFDFWHLNATGTFTLLESCARSGVSKVVFLSSSAVTEWPGMYAHSKLIGESLMEAYRARHDMHIITLRPRAFIPPWNRSVYPSFKEWARWHWKGAVHIDDVAQAVVRSIDALKVTRGEHHPLTVDGLCEYSQDELSSWDALGPGTTFRERFGDASYSLAFRYEIDPTRKPVILGSDEAERVIGYKPTYGFQRLIEDMERNAHSI
ncbi:NAD-dependent epimerase/dehydratase family protein [Streptomyces sp. SAS_272]|uniref:NAD-dependent epimerase/dehydratase family protein n=1 Tax=Streptomyces sp. SAS_272 TaxID=3412747 RepID=UPI00403CA5AE